MRALLRLFSWWCDAGGAAVIWENDGLYITVMVS